MKLVRLALISALLAMPLALAQTAYESMAETSIRYAVMPVSGSGVQGSVFIADYPFLEGAVVSVFLRGTPPGGEHPAHFHIGDCGSNGDIVVPLNSVNGDTGLSVTVTEAPYEAILDENLYLNIHLSPDDIDTIIACGEVGQGAEEVTGVVEMQRADTQDGQMQTDVAEGAAPEDVPEEFFDTLETAFYPFYPTENSNINGTVQITENEDGGARVTVTAQNTQEGVMYPSHFHQGDCGSGGSIIYPLEPVPGGAESVVTNIDASVEEIMNSDLYINLHDPDDLSIIVACGEIGQGANNQ